MKSFGIIGALFFVSAVCFGYFVDFPAASLIAIASAAFGLSSLIIAAYKDVKEKGVKTWKSATAIGLALVGGVLCCIGGLSQSIFETISGAALALLAVIFGVLYAKK